MTHGKLSYETYLIPGETLIPWRKGGSVSPWYWICLISHLVAAGGGPEFYKGANVLDIHFPSLPAGGGPEFYKGPNVLDIHYWYAFTSNIGQV